MNNFCVDLKFPFPVFSPGIDPVIFLKSQPNLAGHFRINPDLLNPEVKNCLKELGLTITIVEIFYRKPNAVSNIHSDLEVVGDYSKLNWVFGGGIMHWFKINDSYTRPIANTTAINSYSLHYNKNEVDLIHSQKVGQPSLVQVGIPHQVVNDNSERFCVSVVFRDDTLKRPTFDKALELFKYYYDSK